MPVLSLSDAFVAFRARCHADGFDVVHPFSVGACDANAPDLKEGQRLAAFDRPDPLGVLVGNTRHFWDAFGVALQRDPSLAELAQPIDEYTVQKLEAAAPLFERGTRIRFAHVLEPAPLGVQRIAEASGLTVTSPSHLGIHPVYGPWLAFRAVVVVDAEASEFPALPPTPAESRCAVCPQPCVPAFETALAATRSASVDSLGDAWPLWAKVRTACPVGEEHRYDEPQIRYHYAKDREVLRALARRR